MAEMVRRYLAFLKVARQAAKYLVNYAFTAINSTLVL